MKKAKRQEFDVRRKSDGVKVRSVYAYTAKQAVGYYIAWVLFERHEQDKFYATATVKPQLSVVKIVGACSKCGYLDPQKDQASHCPNCD